MTAMRIPLDKFKALAQAGAEAAAGLITSKAMVVETKAEEGDGARTIRVRASTGAPDLDNDTVNVHGWDLGDFTKNGPFLWAHDSHSLPVGKSIRTWVEDEALKSVIQFPSVEECGEEHFKFVDSVYRLYKSGYLNAVSVGFMPTEYVINEERGDFAFDFKKQKLLEISAVPVPANPEALIEARSAGIDVAPIATWAEKILDGARGPGLWVPVSKDRLERVRKAAQVGAPTVVDLGASQKSDAGAGEPAKVAPPAPAPTSEVKAEDCPTCRGSGMCQSCNGTGQKSAPIENEPAAPAAQPATQEPAGDGVKLEADFWKKLSNIVQDSLDKALSPSPRRAG